jgi:hypothetical protein
VGGLGSLNYRLLRDYGASGPRGVVFSNLVARAIDMV